MQAPQGSHLIRNVPLHGKAAVRDTLAKVAGLCGRGGARSPGRGGHSLRIQSTGIPREPDLHVGVRVSLLVQAVRQSGIRSPKPDAPSPNNPRVYPVDNTSPKTTHGNNSYLNTPNHDPKPKSQALDPHDKRQSQSPPFVVPI